MSEESYEGYEGVALKFLKRHGMSVWYDVEVETADGLRIRGLVLPAPKGTSDYLFLKLPNGYNIGLNVRRIKSVRRLGKRHVEYKIPKAEIGAKKLPKVTIIGAGGTIASRVEYETGAVKPAFTPYELANAIPEIFEIADVKPLLMYNIFSEDMKPKNWIEIAKRVGEEIRNGASGVIITHGTDTLQYTASALAFMLGRLPVPVILVGAQRSSDRPASDAATNVIAATRFAVKGDVAEVLVAMHANPDDTRILIHRGVRVRKMHSSRRDAFRTIGDVPIAVVEGEKITYLRSDYDRRTDKNESINVDAVFEDKVALLYTYPNMAPELIDVLVDKRFRGLVLVGTGLGHAPENVLPSIRRAVEEGVIVVMATQCIWGPVKMNVYERGRTLLRMGVVPADGMLPEVAYVKLGWLLGHKELDKGEVIRRFQTDLRHEIVRREPISAYFSNI